MSVTRTTLSRRALFRWSSATIGGVGVLGVTGCGLSDDDAESEPDPLLAQAASARRDAATARALTALYPDRAGALSVIADERTAHADALDADVARMAGITADTTTSGTSSTTSAPGAEQPTVEQLREMLVRSQRSAADLARTLTGYRAGLLSSISAACGVQTEVLL